MGNGATTKIVAAVLVALTAMVLSDHGAVSALPTPACRSADYALELMPYRTRGDVLAAVALVTDRTSTCVVSGTLQVTLRHRDGAAVRGVRHARGLWHVTGVLRPWSQLVHTWRWRNWCALPGRFIFTAALAGREVRSNIAAPPSCRHRGAQSRLLDSGPGTRSIPFTGTPIPAHFPPAGTPVPLSGALIQVTNSWLVSDGRTLVAVYAGSAPQSDAGMFAIVRQNLIFGLQDVDVVHVGPIGATTITAAPTGAAVETTAQRADLRYATASGTTGTLHLTDGTTDNG